MIPLDYGDHATVLVPREALLRRSSADVVRYLRRVTGAPLTALAVVRAAPT